MQWMLPQGPMLRGLHSMTKQVQQKLQKQLAGPLAGREEQTPPSNTQHALRLLLWPMTAVASHTECIVSPPQTATWARRWHLSTPQV